MFIQEAFACRVLVPGCVDAMSKRHTKKCVDKLLSGSDIDIVEERKKFRDQISKTVLEISTSV